MAIRKFGKIYHETISLSNLADRILSATEKSSRWADCVQSYHYKQAEIFAVEAQRIRTCTDLFPKMDENLSRGEIKDEGKKAWEINDKSINLKEEIKNMIENFTKLHNFALPKE